MSINLTTGDFEILMSLYRGESPLFFKECIQSIEADINSPNVRLVIDGPLTLDLESIVSQLDQGKWKILRLKHNVGLAEALNEGVNASEKQYLIRLDTDDLWVLNRCDDYLNVLNTSTIDPDVIGGQALLIDAQSNVYSKRIVPLTHNEIVSSLWKCPFIHPSVAIKRDVLIEFPYGTNVGKRQDDYELWFRLNRANKQFLNLDKVLVKYRYTYENWKRNDRSVVIDRIKVLSKYKGKTVFTNVIGFYLIIRSFLRFRLVYKFDMFIKRLV